MERGDHHPWGGLWGRDKGLRTRSTEPSLLNLPPVAAELVAAALQGIKVVGLGMVESKGKYQLLTYITGSWWQQTLWQQICGCWFLEGGEGKFGLRDTIPRRGLFKNIDFFNML